MGRTDGDDGRRRDAGRGVAPPALCLQRNLIQPALSLPNGEPRASPFHKPQLRRREREGYEECEECERSEGWSKGWE